MANAPVTVAEFTKGVETIGKLVAEFPPEKVASIPDLTPSKYAAVKRVCCRRVRCLLRRIVSARRSSAAFVRG